jgi:hypothetical protein
MIRGIRIDEPVLTAKDPAAGSLRRPLRRRATVTTLERMPPDRARRSRLPLFIARGALGILLVIGPAELALRLIAVVSPETRYLSTARGAESRRRFTSLREYLASRTVQVVPHRQWFNYWTNALGFNDEEFTVPKPAGRFRIMAVGDSFTFGLVPYPQNVMTVLEASLRTACPGRDLDLLNFGIGGTNLADYRRVIELGSAYEPDLVLVNVYAGNDAPDLYRRTHEGPSLHAWLRHSYLWTYVRNVLAVRRSVPGAGELVSSVQGPALVDPAGKEPRGGQVVDPGRRLRDDDPALVGPIFDEKAFARLLAVELGRFYVPRDAGAIERAWQPALEQIEAARARVAAQGGRLVITLYPSVLQVDPRLRSDAIDRLRGRARDARITADAIDPRLPNRILLAYCREHGVTCLDLTPVFERASRESAEPLYKARELHWTPRGNRVAGDAQARYLAPLVCGPAAPGTGRPSGSDAEHDAGRGRAVVSEPVLPFPHQVQLQEEDAGLSGRPERERERRLVPGSHGA